MKKCVMTVKQNMGRDFDAKCSNQSNVMYFNLNLVDIIPDHLICGGGHIWSPLRNKCVPTNSLNNGQDFDADGRNQSMVICF